MKYEHILVPTDFSADAEHALEHVIGLARQCQSRLTLLHVVCPYLAGSAEASFPAYTAQLRRDADQQLQKPRKRIEEAGVSADVITEMGMPADKIVEVARNRQVDLWRHSCTTVRPTSPGYDDSSLHDPLNAYTHRSQQASTPSTCLWAGFGHLSTAWDSRSFRQRSAPDQRIEPTAIQTQKNACRIFLHVTPSSIRTTFAAFLFQAC